MTTLLYNIVVDIKDGDPFVLKRTLEALEIFATDVDGYYFPDDIKNTQRLLSKPSLDLEKSSKRAAPATAMEIQYFLNYCLQEGNIVRSQALADFLWEELPEANNSLPHVNPVSAIDFILQPFENQSVYIPRGRQFYVDLQLSPSQILVWRFSIGCGFDLDFCTLFRESQLSKPQRNDSSTALKKPPAAMAAQTYNTATKIFGQISSQLFDKILQRGLKRLDESLRQPEFRTVQLVTPLHKCHGRKKPSHSSPISGHTLHTTNSSKDLSVGADGESVDSSSDLSSVPITGSFSADKGGGLLRLVWDNSFSRFTGKHIQYCVQCVSESTMQAALQAAEEMSLSLARPRSRVYQSILDSVSADPSTVCVDGPWLEFGATGPYDIQPHTRIFLGDEGEKEEEGGSLTSRYLDSSRREDHLNFVYHSQPDREVGDGEDGDAEDIVLDQGLLTGGRGHSSDEVMAAPHQTGRRSAWLGAGTTLGTLYGLPSAGGALLSMGVTRGVAGFTAVGGLVGGVIQTPIVISRHVASLVGGSLYTSPTLASRNADAASDLPELDSSTPLSEGVEMTTVDGDTPQTMAQSDTIGDGLVPLSVVDKTVANRSSSSRAVGATTSAPVSSTAWGLSSLYSWSTQKSPDTPFIRAGSSATADDRHGEEMCTEIASRMEAALHPSTGQAPSNTSCATGTMSSSLSHSEFSGGSLKDILTLAHKVDALEDDICTLQAERDQAEARLTITRVHLDAMRSDKENAEKAQAELDHMLSKQSEQYACLDKDFTVLQKKYDDLFRSSIVEKEQLLLRVKAASAEASAASERMEQLRKEVSVWSAAQGVVEDELAKLSEAREHDSMDSHRLAEERAQMQRDRDTWQVDKRELCGRIADLELEVSNLVTASANALACGVIEVESDEEGAAGEDRGVSLTADERPVIDSLRAELCSAQAQLAESTAAVTDYSRRLDEVQGELILQRAQKRIDDREMRRMRRECGNICLAARGEVAESRMMQRHYLDKLSRIRAEKKVLLKELRALRSLGLYEGPLTTDSTKMSRTNSHDDLESSSDNKPAIAARNEKTSGAEVGVVSSESAVNTPNKKTATSMATTPPDSEPTVSAKGELTVAYAATESIGCAANSTMSVDEGRSSIGSREGGDCDYFEGYCSAVLAELSERRAVVEEMRKVDPGSRALQQLAEQLDTQAKSLLTKSKSAAMAILREFYPGHSTKDTCEQGGGRGSSPNESSEDKANEDEAAVVRRLNIEAADGLEHMATRVGKQGDDDEGNVPLHNEWMARSLRDWNDV